MSSGTSQKSSFLCGFDSLRDGQARAFEVNGESLFLVRSAGTVFAYENRCPHRFLELNWLPDTFLDHSKSFIQCAVHGALFQIEDGRCIVGPCIGDSLSPRPITIVDGQIFLQQDDT
ncbi:Rieske (2Fe-2S) protein [Mangrovitalea sediminis]|uniref:Rieske (2Fe-2S) protein n=1 Tax=Mangrovitalea sediminis TaxID=1982043 RepID=UPI000BE56611|nr:Rieske 2Fe-2S domain-containing protein [Mangrovitalea sediminis]